MTSKTALRSFRFPNAGPLQDNESENRRGSLEFTQLMQDIAEGTGIRQIMLTRSRLNEANEKCVYPESAPRGDRYRTGENNLWLPFGTV